MVILIRYLDTFTRGDKGWLFAERRLVTDWMDNRPSTA